MSKPASLKNQGKYLLIIYVAVAVFHLIALVTALPAFAVMISKSMLMPALMLYFILDTNLAKSANRMIVILALFFSWLGDCILLFQEESADFFLIGLVCFLLAHMSYILAFSKTGNPNQSSILRRMPWLILFFIGYAVIILIITKEGLGSMLIPVIIYMCVILLMSLSALNRYGKVSSASFISVFAGAIFFMLSDSLLAINKFSHPIPMASFLIMLTYMAAQYFIVRGMIKEQLN